MVWVKSGLIPSASLHHFPFQDGSFEKAPNGTYYLHNIYSDSGWQICEFCESIFRIVSDLIEISVLMASIDQPLGF